MNAISPVDGVSPSIGALKVSLVHVIPRVPTRKITWEHVDGRNLHEFLICYLIW